MLLNAPLMMNQYICFVKSCPVSFSLCVCVCVLCWSLPYPVSCVLSGRWLLTWQTVWGFSGSAVNQDRSSCCLPCPIVWTVLASPILCYVFCC